MIYATQERAEEVASRLNGRDGYPMSKAVLTEHGWTVVCSYEFGATRPTPEQRAAYKDRGWV